MAASADMAPAPVSGIGAAGASITGAGHSLALVPTLSAGLSAPLAGPMVAAPSLFPAALAASPLAAPARAEAAPARVFSAPAGAGTSALDLERAPLAPAADAAFAAERFGLLGRDGASRPGHESGPAGRFSDSRLTRIFDGAAPGRASPDLSVPGSEAAPGTVKVTREVGRHFDEDGVIGRRGAGIKGAHTRGKFLAALAGQGKIVSETPVPGYDGFSIVQYKFYKEVRGAVTETLKDGEPMVKTVVDDTRWSPDRISALAQTVFGREPLAPAAAPAKAAETYQIFVVRGRVRFVGWVDKTRGALVSFGVDKILP
jgi:hypothetical protein